MNAASNPRSLVPWTTVLLVLVIAGCVSPGDSASPAGLPVPRSSGQNLIRNGDFAHGLENWNTIGGGPNAYHPEDPGRAAFSPEDGALSIRIVNQGTSIWSVMFYQSVPFEKGVTYDISFEAGSDSGITVISNICQDGTWRNFSGDRSFKLTNSLSKFTYHFTMAEDGQALFQLCMGASGTGKVRFGHIAIRKSGGT
jgi:Carbohydrate binding domain